MRIVFLGGTRFIGHAAATAAVARGHEVLLLHPGDVAGAREVRVDRADPSALARVVAEVRPDVVVDTRAMTKADAESAALALKIARAPAIVISSQDVYAAFGALLGHQAPPPEAVVTESSPLTVPFPYRGTAREGAEDYDKKLVEAVFRDAADNGVPRVCVLRLPAVYGRRDYQRRFGAIFDALEDRRDVFCTGGATWRWTHAHVLDVAHAVVIAAERARASFAVYNVGEESTPTMRERVEAMAHEMHAPLRWREIDDPLPAGFEVLGRAQDVVVSSAKIRAELGFEEITRPDDRVRDLVEWCRKSRPPSA